jgi:hypothetical protein
MHISDTDLERYHLGMVTGMELDTLEEDIIGCPTCADRAAETTDYVDAVRAGIILGISIWYRNCQRQVDGGVWEGGVRF